jgi:hypothetical protein
MQSFLEGIVMREINEREAQRQPRREEENEEREGLFSSASTKQPTGLGIAERLRSLPTRSDDDERDPPAPTPVVVNVGSNANSVPSGSGDIERLATFVVGGRDFERSMRLRTAIGILHATAASDEERHVLAARLDEAIATKTKTAVEENGGGPLKMARVAFDKLKDLF